MNGYNVNELRSRLEEIETVKLPVFAADNSSIPGYALIAKADTLEPIRIMSDKYSLVQHTEVFDKTIEKVNQIGVAYDISKFDLQFDTADGRSAGNSRFKMSVTFPELTMNVDGSPIEASLDVYNSNDGTLKYTEMFGAFRVLCTNGMVIGQKMISVGRRHTRNFVIEDNTNEMFDAIRINFSEHMEKIEKMQNIKVTQAFINALAKAGFPTKIVNNLPEWFAKYATDYNETLRDITTIWAYYQVLTNYLSTKVSTSDITRYHNQQNRLLSIVNNFMR